MKKLLVYVPISRDPFPLVPAELAQLESDDVRLADIDQKSGSEVFTTIYTAIDLAEEVVVVVQVENMDEDISGLFGLFKRLSKRTSSVTWIQLGHHPQLKIFEKKLSPGFKSTYSELLEDVSRICTQ